MILIVEGDCLAHVWTTNVSEVTCSLHLPDRGTRSRPLPIGEHTLARRHKSELVITPVRCTRNDTTSSESHLRRKGVGETNPLRVRVRERTALHPLSSNGDGKRLPSTHTTQS